NADNRDFVTQGLSALLSSSGFSGSFTSYGITVAVNGTALPAGSSVLMASENLVVAFDPWSLAVSVFMYAVMSLASCNQAEGQLAMKEGARLCHTLGSYCSSCIRLLGKCISCIENTTGKCCFNSVLARIVNEQGRNQVGRGWGDPRSPDCSGFTLAQLQALDFSQMDLSEFYASIVPTLPGQESVLNRVIQKSPECYYGKGKCQ
nr:conjugal transfer protein TraN [Rhodoferax sp.]